MQEYLQRTRLGALMDQAGETLLIAAGSVFLYVLLWGLRPMALLAGAATCVLALLGRGRTRQRRLQRREERLRRQIGGELQMEAWLACPPARAHFETALLLSGITSLRVRRAMPEGAVCTWEGKEDRWLVACAQLPRSEKLEARDVAAFQRACLRHKAARGCLCGAAGVTSEALEQAELPPAVSFISREQMIALAGAAAPAGDRQLVALGKRAHRGRGARLLRHTALQPQRAEKYLMYGLLLLGLYIVSGQPYYPLPGLICLALMTMCRVSGSKEKKSLLDEI